MKKIIILLKIWLIILKFDNKLVFVENKAVKNFLYYMRDGKIFVISNNLENHTYMTSNNPVIGSWLDVVFHTYMTSNNPVIGSWLDVVFHSYQIMTIICYKYFLIKYNPLKKPLSQIQTLKISV